MPARVFFPQIPTDQDEFLKVVGEHCSINNVKKEKSKKGRYFCILPINNFDSKGKCANDVIDALTDKKVGGTILKPRMHVDQFLLKLFEGSRPTSLLFGMMSVLGYVADNEDDTVSVTHYSSDLYYVQLRSETNQNVLVAQNLDSLYEEYRSNMLTLLDIDELSEGTMYASTYKNENHLFRIRVLEKCNENDIKVLFVDYGNTELIRDQPILSISSKLTNIPPLAHQCSINGIRIIDKKHHDSLSREVLNRVYKAKLYRTKNEFGVECITSIDFLDFTTVSYRTFLIIEGAAENLDYHVDKPLSPNSNSQSNSLVRATENGFKENSESAIVTHMESLEEFYVQLAKKSVESNLGSVTKKIKFLTSRLKDDLQYINDDIMYLSKFTADGLWYRSRVIENCFDEVPPSCLVQFIDFGNTERKQSSKDLIPLVKEWHEEAVELSQIPPCACRCTFSRHLLSGLTSANLGLSFFQKEIIDLEKIVKIIYSEKDRKEWIVHNMVIDGDEDIVSKCCVTKEMTDKYSLGNIDISSRIWFQLVSSADAKTDNQIESLKKWSAHRISDEIHPVSNCQSNKLYCTPSKEGKPLRCRIIGRNAKNAVIQLVDSGIYDKVDRTSIYHVPPFISSIKPMSRAYKLAIKLKKEKEKEAEKKITSILGHSDVELQLLSESVIRDVIVDGQSLVERLAEFSVAQENEVNSEEGSAAEEGGVDFSLPSVEQMIEVPTDVAVQNWRMRLLRQLLQVNVECYFDKVWTVTSQCGHLTKILNCCSEVDDISSSLAYLDSEFNELLVDRKCKIRDLQSLIDRRTSLVTRIITGHSALRSMLDTTSLDSMQSLQANVQTTLYSLSNLLSLFEEHSDANSTVNTEIDIGAMQRQVTEFYQSSLYTDQLLPRFLEHARVTDDAIDKMHSLFDVMCGANASSAGQPINISLIDSTYAMHAAIKAENDDYMTTMSTEDVVALVKMSEVLSQCHRFLQAQRVAVDTIVTRSIRYEVLSEYARSMVREEDGNVFERVDEGHRRVMASRSALRHAVPDLEDAEEMDMRERQQELHARIDEIRAALHRDLAASDQLLDVETWKLMLRKRELQLKNQSIFFHDEGMPIFLWEPIYFDLSQESADSYFTSQFGDSKVTIKRLSLSHDDYRIIIGNFSVFSSRSQPGGVSGAISVVPVKHAFLSKSGTLALYLVCPQFSLSTAMETSTVVDTVVLVRDVINQIVDLWHMGFIYYEDDMRLGLFVRVQDGAGEPRVCLPLPLTSIVNREKLGAGTMATLGSINVGMARLGAFFEQAVVGSGASGDEALSRLESA